MPQFNFSKHNCVIFRQKIIKEKPNSEGKENTFILLQLLQWFY